MSSRPFPDIYGIQSLAYESSQTNVYRAERKDDGRHVLLKQLKSTNPTQAELARLKNEFNLTHGQEIPGILRALELVLLEEHPTLVLEDFPGAPLREMIQEGPLPLALALELTLALSRHLDQLHRQGIIHRNLNPDSVLVDRVSRQVRITNLEFATILQREHREIVNPQGIGQDLRYIAPEQTGRMNCPIDYRCDFYAAGIMLYEMVTGGCPFTDNDPMAMVYAHLAAQPLRPTRLQPELPSQIEDLILKLLQKNPEERYQSARALSADLKQCLADLASPEGIRKFPLGRHDLRGGLHSAIRLYGRQRETAVIMQTFAEVCEGRHQLLLIAGYSGVGKTSLVREVYQPITKARGYFAKGKYDQLEKNIPFSAMFSAFRNLLNQVLTETDTRLDYWRDRLLAAIGQNGRLLTDVLPELELIIGVQPEVETLLPVESKNRFNATFRQFIHIFCKREHPLVVFLDDLQWIDTASLDLLQLLMADDQAHHLLVLGAYRDNEVEKTHPLALTLQEFKARQIPVRQIELGPLTENDANQLIADSLEDPLENVKPLTELVMEKTRGNPFFLLQFLRRLYSDKLLSFDETSRHWQWDLEQIKAHNISDNVVEMMVERLRQLSLPAQDMLRLAACIGNSFDLRILADVSKQTPAVTFKQLLPALQEELIVNKSGFVLTDQRLETTDLVIFEFQFQHDRIQQAAYSLIPKNQLPKRHLDIGRSLLDNPVTTAHPEQIFAVADHFNSGRSLLSAEKDLIELARLNLNAARLAREATAYQAALKYLAAGMERLPDSVWQSDYTFALELHRERALADSLNGNFDQSETLIRDTTQIVCTAVEKAELLHMLISQYTLAARYPEAIALACETLSLLGIDIPAEELDAERDRQMLAVDEKLADKSIRSLLDLPRMTAPDKVVAMRVLTAMGPPCYRSHQKLWAVIVSMEMNLLLEYGNVPAAAYTYTSYGGLLGYVRGDYRNCQQYAELAVGVAEKYQSSGDLSVAHLMIGASLDHWFRHLKFAEQSYQKAYQVGLDSGNLQYAVYAFGHQMYCRFFRGMPLDMQLEELPHFLEFSQERKNRWGIDLKLGMLMVVRNLTGKTGGIQVFDSGDETESEYLARCERQQNVQVLCIYRLLKAYALFLHGDYPAAMENLGKAEKDLPAVATQGLLPSAEFYFVKAMLLAAGHNNFTAAQQEEAHKEVGQILQQLGIWADLCPENFRHKKILVAAELAVLEERFFEADHLYEQAADEAGKQGFIHHQALAWERAACLWQKHDKPSFARLYWQKARNAYRLWGAQRKLTVMADSLPEVADGRIFSEGQGPSLEASVDLMSVIKASQVISGQVRHQDLLTTLMKIVLENSGAEKAVLATPSATGFEITAVIDHTKTLKMLNKPMDAEGAGEISPAMVNYVARSHEPLILKDENRESLYEYCSYLRKLRPSSAACLPLLNRGRLLGVVYFESSVTAHAYGKSRLQMLQLLAAQAAISFENAAFYSDLEDRVRDRTAKLNQVNEQLQKSEKKYRTLFESMSQPMALHEIICDEEGKAVDYRFLDINPAFEKLMGNTRHEIVGRTAVELLPDLQSFWIETYGKVAQEQHSAHFQEFSRPLNRYFDVVAFPTETGQFAVVASDMTEFMRAQEQQHELEAQLYQAQKIESVGRLAGGVAHDYNNMLAVIIGYAELAQMKVDQSHSLHGDLDEILKAARRSRDITRQLLAFARKQIIEPKVLDLNVQIESMLKMLRNLLGENIDLAWIPTNGLWPVEVDPTQLDQVLANLCINARDAITGAGRMTIETAKVTFDHDYCARHRGFVPGDFVLMVVNDTGCGMDQETLQHMFEPFFTTKNQGEGTGLGLATVYGIVKQSNGFINVYSEPGKGTSFKIYFPRKQGVPGEEGKKPENEIIKGQDETILLVEDEPALLALTQTMLRDMGYKVLAASTPSEALRLAEVHHKKLDLLVTDVVMPEMNGRELSDRIREFIPELECLYMSGYTENAVAHHGVLDKGLHFIPKPFSIADFSLKIKEALTDK